MANENDMENQENLSKNEKKCGCKLLIWLVSISLILSIANLTFSIITYTSLNGDSHRREQRPGFLISKKYDKGQSFEKAKNTNKPVLAFFYVDWCGFCKKFAPTFHAVSKNRDIKKNVAIAYINCEDEKNKELVKQFNVHAYPTVFVVKPNGEKIQLDNHTFFNDKSADIVKQSVLDFVK